MNPHLSLVTLGVADLARSRAFYRALGFVESSASQAEVAFFQAGGVAISLFGRAALAEDAGVDPPAAASRASAWRTTSPPSRMSMPCCGRRWPPAPCR